MTQQVHVSFIYIKDIFVWSVALYSAEIWTLKQRDRNKLGAFEMCCSRRL